MSELDKLADLPPRARRRQLFEIEKEVGTKQPKKLVTHPNQQVRFRRRFS